MLKTPSVLIGHRYKQLELLGMGGMGVVYHATDRLTGEDVALKRVNVPTSLLQDMPQSGENGFTDLQLALANEFKVLASLRHPNIISVLDYGFDSNRQPYYTMELLRDPQTLLNAAGRRPLAAKISLIIQVLQALTYLHRRGVVHCDLKPENVLIVNEQAKLLDFGLAIAHEIHARDDKSSRGTLFYMAPEVLNGQGATAAADQYAVGVLAFEIFAGRHPFLPDGLSVIDYVTMVLDDQPELDLLVAPPEIAGVIGRLLEKRPEARFKNTQEAITALSIASGIAQPGEIAAIRESFVQAARFVGRHEEFSRLQGALNQAIQGKGSAWLIGGEIGVGKSRLLDELRTQGLVFGSLVLRGHAESIGGQPYQVWRNPVRRLVLDTTLTDLEAGVLKELVPDIESLIDRSIPDVPPLPESANQQRLIATISELFRKQTEPIVLILEDLQWAVESLEPLKALSAFVGDLPLLIVGSYRNEEAPKLPGELPALQLLRLGRLNYEDVAELTASIIGPIDNQAAVVDLLQQQTEGNALFITEVVRALAEDAGQLEAIGATVPPSVFVGGMKKIIQRRLDQVPESARRLLKYAAVIGRQIDRKLLRVFAAETELESWLITGNEVSVLDIQDEQWRFAHDKLRETLLESIDAAELRDLHQQVAEAIETVYGQDESWAYMLFDHWYAAQVPEKAAHYAEIAGPKMILVGNYKDALTMLQRALDSATAPEMQPVRILLLRHAGNANFYTGDFPAAVAHFTQGLILAQQLDYRSEIIALFGRLGGTANEMANYQEARAYCQQGLAIARLENDPLSVARLEMVTAVSYTNEGNYKQAADYLQRSIDYFQQIGEKKLQGDALVNLGVIATYQSDFAKARHYWTEGLHLFSEIGDSHGRCICLNNLGGIANEQSDFKTALTYLAPSLDIARKTGDRRIMSLALDNLGVASQMLGDFDNAIVYWQQAISIVQQINYATVLTDLQMNLGGIHLIGGEYEQALQDFQEAQRISQARGRQREYANALRGVADTLCEQGELISAQQTIDQAVALMRELGNRDLLVNATWVLGKIALRSDDPQKALTCFQDSLVLAREIADPGRTAESLALMAVARMAVGQRSETSVAVIEGLQTALSISVTGTLLHLLSAAALVLYSNNDFEHSAAIYGLCFDHRCTSTFFKQQVLAPLYASLEKQPGLEALLSAQKRVVARDLLDVSNEVIAQLAAH